MDDVLHVSDVFWRIERNGGCLLFCIGVVYRGGSQVVMVGDIAFVKWCKRKNLRMRSSRFQNEILLVLALTGSSCLKDGAI